MDSVPVSRLFWVEKSWSNLDSQYNRSKAISHDCEALADGEHCVDLTLEKDVIHERGNRSPDQHPSADIPNPSSPLPHNHQASGGEYGARSIPWWCSSVTAKLHSHLVSRPLRGGWLQGSG